MKTRQLWIATILSVPLAGSGALLGQTQYGPAAPDPHRQGRRRIAEEAAYGSELRFENAVNTEVDGLVPYEVVERIARKKATRVWGQVAAGTPIACCDETGDLVAYLCPFRIGVEPFPSYAEILRGVTEGRTLASEMADTPFAAKLVGTPEAPSPSSADASQEPSDHFRGELPQRVVSPAPPVEASQELFKRARMKELGIGEYGAVYVSARYDRYPIPLCSHYLPPFFAKGDLALAKAGQVLQTETPTLVRYYFLGRRGQYFEFTSEDRTAFVHAHSLEITGRPRFEPRIPSEDALADMQREWAALTGASPATKGGE